MITKVYLHSDKDNMSDKAVELNLSKEARDKFVYALSEIEFEIHVGEIEGEVTILQVNGQRLIPKTLPVAALAGEYDDRN